MYDSGLERTEAGILVAGQMVMTKPKVLNDHFRQSWKWICDQLEPARRWITAN